MPTLWQRLSVMWRDAGLMIRPAVDSMAIRQFESKYRVTLPADIREYFSTVDGMEDDLDPGSNRFWPLAIVKPVSEELTEHHADRWAYPDCFVFADHCIWCFAWAVRLGTERLDVSGPVFQVTGGGEPGRLIAHSFTEFVEMYLKDWRNVL